jgi:branched-chain amino acid transport system ATP-binding protein
MRYSERIRHEEVPMSTPAPSVPRLRVADLSVSFGGLQALTDVSFEVDAGAVVALIGPNGAGKTTVFNSISGLVRHRGVITVDGSGIPRRTAGLLGRGVARTLQGLGLFDGLTVRENVAVPVVGTADAAARVAAQLAAHSLTDVAETPAGALAYPLRKRVALARALVTEPRLLLLDEPAGGLGEEDIAALGATIRAVAAAGSAILLVEHHVDFVMSVADRIVVLDFGRVIARGTPDEVRGDPRVEEAYLGVQATA